MFKSRIRNLSVDVLRQMLSNDGYRVKKGRVVMEELIFTTDPYNDSYRKGETFATALQDGSEFILVERDGEEHYIGLAGLCTKAEQSTKHTFDRRRPTVRFCSTAEEHLLESEGKNKILTSFGPGPTFVVTFAYYPLGIQKLQLDCFLVPTKLFSNKDLKLVNTTRQGEYKDVARIVEDEVSKYGTLIEGQCIVTFDLEGGYYFTMLDILSLGEEDLNTLKYEDRVEVFLESHRCNLHEDRLGNVFLVSRDEQNVLDPEFVLAPVYRRYYLHVLAASSDNKNIVLSLGVKGGVEILRVKLKSDQLRDDALRSITTTRSVSIVCSLITRDKVKVISVQRCAGNVNKTLERLVES